MEKIGRTLVTIGFWLGGVSYGVGELDRDCVGGIRSGDFGVDFGVQVNYGYTPVFMRFESILGAK